MNTLAHPIYKDIYDLCKEIENLPASEQATKLVMMASNLEQPSNKLVNSLREIKRLILNMTSQTQQRDLGHIIRICLNAGIIERLPELNRGRVAYVDELCFELRSVLRAALEKHPTSFNSPHEGYAVIKEELEELWEHVKKDTGRSVDARKEAMQIAAMGLRYALDICHTTPSTPSNPS